MKKLMFLVCIISTGLSAVTPTTSPTTSPTKYKKDGAIKVVREEVFRQQEKKGVDRKQARKVARSVVRQLEYDKRQK